MSTYQKTVLENGLTIVSENIPHSRSVSLGVWVKSGSRHENPDEMGLAHFVEHMLFKGTEKRTAKQIAQSLESVGGYLNAYTTKEYTCYYAEVLDEFTPLALDVLSDMICHSTFPEGEVDKEREVVLDEIESIEDTPDDLIQEVFTEKLYPDSSLGWPILGTAQSVRSIGREELFNFYRKHYSAENIVISSVGKVSHQELVEQCDTLFSALPSGASQSRQPVSAPQIGSGVYRIPRSVNQTHICLGTAALPYTHQKKYHLLILNTLLGVGMGSRLFQNIREKYGMAYSIYSYLDFFRDSGLMAIYLGTDRHKTTRAIELLEKEVRDLAAQPVDNTEMQQVKAQLKGGLLLALENNTSRMNRLAKMEMYLGELQSIDQIVHQIERVTPESLLEFTNELLKKNPILSVIFTPAN